VAAKRIYVRDREGKFAETGTLNKKLKSIAADLSTMPNTSLSRRITFRQHGITNPAHQKKIVGHLGAQRRSRQRKAGLTATIPVKVTNGKKSYRKGN
jgi:hypothetical protein